MDHVSEGRIKIKNKRADAGSYYTKGNYSTRKN